MQLSIFCVQNVCVVSLHNAEMLVPELLPEREISADLTRRDLRGGRPRVAAKQRWFMIITRKCCRCVWRVVHNHSQSAGHKRELGWSCRLMVRGITLRESLIHIRHFVACAFANGALSTDMSTIIGTIKFTRFPVLLRIRSTFIL